MTEPDMSPPPENDPAQELQSRFPELRPMGGTPSLFTVNGFGLTLYGRRDSDPETATYVKTHCLAALFVPVLCLGAYRVVDAPGGGWYFVGKSPLSALAKAFNGLTLAIALLIGLAIAASIRESSPEYKAEQLVLQAQKLEGETKPVEAAKVWCKAATGPRRAEGRAALTRLLSGPLREVPLKVSTDAVRAIRDSPYRNQVLNGEGLEGWLSFLKAKVADDAPGVLLHVHVLRAMDPTLTAAIHEAALRAVVAETPTDGKAVSALALLLEARDEVKLAEPLLRAAGVEALANTEGARILGQIMARQGEVEAAHALLGPYVESRLKTVQQLKARLLKSYEAVQRAAGNALNQGAAGADFKRRYDTASKEKQAAMVNEWVTKRVRSNPDLLKQRTELQEANRVIPVALDLALVKIQRARSLPDPATRKSELEGAEQILLDLQKVAGATLASKLNLGKVRFQLGKSKAGRALFDEVLADAKRSPQALLSVAQACREVGVEADARALSEEAWKTGDAAFKPEAASFRALVAVDQDERVLWLGRSKADDPGVAANLASARGNQALRNGDTQAAIKHFKQAVSLYSKLRPEASTYNNVALVHLRLFSLTGQAAQIKAYTQNLAKAEALLPSHPILMSNAAAALVVQATLDVIGERLKFGSLRASPTLTYLAYLYDDPQGRAALFATLSKNEHFRGAIARYGKLQILSPKLPAHPIALFSLLSIERDPTAYEALLTALRAADLDRADQGGGLGVRTSPILEKDQEALKKEVTRRAEIVQRARAEGHPATLALAICQEIETRLATVSFAKVDLDALLAKAEEALRVSPSQGARATKTSVLIQRAAQRLETAQPAFAEMRKRVQRALSARSLITIGLLRPELTQAVASDPDVREVAKLLTQRVTADPTSLEVWHATLLSRCVPEVGKRAAALIAQDRVYALQRQARALLDPYDLEGVFLGVFEAHLRGDPKAATQLLQAAKQRTLPLPYDPR